MSLIKGIATLASLLIFIWASLLGIILFIDTVVFSLIDKSWLRSILGMGLYFLWVLAWLAAIVALAKRLVVRSSLKRPQLRA